LHRLTVMINDIDDVVYCPICGACGEEGCCPPEMCQHKPGCQYPYYDNNIWIKIKRPFYYVYGAIKKFMFDKFKISLPFNPFGTYWRKYK
jgi:hypothetical protein